MDTRFWGPDGWRLFHSIAASYPTRPTRQTQQLYQKFYQTVALILPCIYCRDSFHRFLKELPIKDYLGDRRELNNWMYQIHNKVNQKLANQNLPVLFNKDFEGIYQFYQQYAKSFSNPKNETFVPGWDFLYCTLFNYPTKRNFPLNEPDRHQGYIDFIYLLAEVLPFPTLQETLKEHLVSHPIENYLSRGQLKHWIHQLEKRYCRKTGLRCPCYRDRCNSIELHRAGCNGKNDPKPTCRSNWGRVGGECLSPITPYALFKQAQKEHKV